MNIEESMAGRCEESFDERGVGFKGSVTDFLSRLRDIPEGVLRQHGTEEYDDGSLTGTAHFIENEETGETCMFILFEDGSYAFSWD